MGKTFRRGDNKGYDDERQSYRKGKSNHANGRKSGGMRIINEPLEDDDYSFDDETGVQDTITINKYRYGDN